MDFFHENGYVGSGLSQEAADNLACIQGSEQNHVEDFTFENSTGFDMEIPNQEFYSPSFSGSAFDYQQVWSSHGEGSSSHDFVNQDLIEEYQLNPLSHKEIFSNFPYANGGNNYMHEVLSQNSNMIPILDFPGYCAGDILQPFNISERADSNACPTWKAIDNSTDNIHPMLLFSGHSTQNKITSQLGEQICPELDESSEETNNVAPTVREHWTPKDDE
jgi:hypothetical protein